MAVPGRAWWSMRCGLPPKQRRRGFLIAEWSRKRPALARTDGGRMPDGASESIAADASIATGPEPRPEPGGRRPAPPGPAAGRLSGAAAGHAVLFEDEFRPDQADATLERLARAMPAAVRDHARRIVDGVLQHRAELDAEIARHARPSRSASSESWSGRSSERDLRVLYSAATSGRPSTMPYRPDIRRRRSPPPRERRSWERVRPSGSEEEPETGDRRNHLRTTQEDHRRAARR